ncbi:MAG: ABC transporter ATP-binding protein, partial [Lachnospiraceae bacterium]|nr:ABC transporter ATP-binding protein [Lachnospiraceae bacterium]
IVEFEGKSILGVAPHKVVSEGMALCPEGRRVFAQLSVKENLEMGAYTRPASEIPETLEKVYEHFPRLKERQAQMAGTLSGGEQQMLAVGRALMSKPELIMMDEPSLGLAPLVVQGIFDIIREINNQGVTILLIEQNANMALKAAHKGYVMETGTITMTGNGLDLLNDESVKAAYLGKKK